MAITIITVGRKQNDSYALLEDVYIKRIGMNRVNSVYIRDKNSMNDRIAAVEEEGRDIIRRISGNDFTVLLDKDGEMFTSMEFADILERGSITFIIGGIDGVSASVRDRADLCISFSKMTMPHQLARVFLMEQIYRASAIKKGGKYHR